jgi:PEP-CTERM motif
VPLTENGEGQAISEADSNRIGWIAGIGARALAAGGTANLDLAAAAQAAIWDIAYAGDSVTSVTADPTISADLATLLGDVFPDRGYATAMQPFGVGWPDVGASQQMVIGFNAPEPSTWAMMLLGFAGLACAGYRSTHRGRSIAA